MVKAMETFVKKIKNLEKKGKFRKYKSLTALRSEIENM